MVTLKEYASSKGCSYEAVRKQVNRYKKELDGHISKVGRTQYLDEDAVIFLDSKRASNPIIVLENGKDEEIRRLNEENKRLLIKIADLQEALLQEKDQVKELQEQKMKLLEQKERSAEKKRWWQVRKKQ